MLDEANATTVPTAMTIMDVFTTWGFGRRSLKLGVIRSCCHQKAVQ